MDNTATPRKRVGRPPKASTTSSSKGTSFNQVSELLQTTPISPVPMSIQHVIIGDEITEMDGTVLAISPIPEGQAMVASHTVGSSECRRSSRKKIIKFDVRDLLSKNRKSHKIQIEARIDSNAPTPLKHETKILVGKTAITNVSAAPDLTSKQKTFIEKSAIFRRFSISEQQNKIVSPLRPPPLPKIALLGADSDIPIVDPSKIAQARRLSRTHEMFNASMLKSKQNSSLIVAQMESSSSSSCSSIAPVNIPSNTPKKIGGGKRKTTAKAVNLYTATLSTVHTEPTVISAGEPQKRRGRPPKNKSFVNAVLFNISKGTDADTDINVSGKSTKSNIVDAQSQMTLEHNSLRKSDTLEKNYNYKVSDIALTNTAQSNKEAPKLTPEKAKNWKEYKACLKEINVSRTTGKKSTEIEDSIQSSITCTISEEKTPNPSKSSDILITPQKLGTLAYETPQENVILEISSSSSASVSDVPSYGSESSVQLQPKSPSNCTIEVNESKQRNFAAVSFLQESPNLDDKLMAPEFIVAAVEEIIETQTIIEDSENSIVESKTGDIECDIIEIDECQSQDDEERNFGIKLDESTSSESSSVMNKPSLEQRRNESPRTPSSSESETNSGRKNKLYKPGDTLRISLKRVCMPDSPGAYSKSCEKVVSHTITSGTFDLMNMANNVSTAKRSQLFQGTKQHDSRRNDSMTSEEDIDERQQRKHFDELTEDEKEYIIKSLQSRSDESNRNLLTPDKEIRNMIDHEENPEIIKTPTPIIFLTNQDLDGGTVFENVETNEVISDDTEDVKVIEPNEEDKYESHPAIAKGNDNSVCEMKTTEETTKSASEETTKSQRPQVRNKDTQKHTKGHLTTLESKTSDLTLKGKSVLSIESNKALVSKTQGLETIIVNNMNETGVGKDGFVKPVQEAAGSCDDLKPIQKLKTVAANFPKLKQKRENVPLSDEKNNLLNQSKETQVDVEEEQIVKSPNKNEDSKTIHQPIIDNIKLMHATVESSTTLEIKEKTQKETLKTSEDTKILKPQKQIETEVQPKEDQEKDAIEDRIASEDTKILCQSKISLKDKQKEGVSQISEDIKKLHNPIETDINLDIRDEQKEEVVVQISDDNKIIPGTTQIEANSVIRDEQENQQECNEGIKEDIQNKDQQISSDITILHPTIVVAGNLEGTEEIKLPQPAIENETDAEVKVELEKEDLNIIEDIKIFHSPVDIEANTEINDRRKDDVRISEIITVFQSPKEIPAISSVGEEHEKEDVQIINYVEILPQPTEIGAKSDDIADEQKKDLKATADIKLMHPPSETKAKVGEIQPTKTLNVSEDMRPPKAIVTNIEVIQRELLKSTEDIQILSAPLEVDGNAKVKDDQQKSVCEVRNVENILNPSMEISVKPDVKHEIEKSCLKIAGDNKSIQTQVIPDTSSDPGVTVSKLVSPIKPKEKVAATSPNKSKGITLPPKKQVNKFKHLEVATNPKGASEDLTLQKFGALTKQNIQNVNVETSTLLDILRTVQLRVATSTDSADMSASKELSSTANSKSSESPVDQLLSSVGKLSDSVVQQTLPKTRTASPQTLKKSTRRYERRSRRGEDTTHKTLEETFAEIAEQSSKEVLELSSQESVFEQLDDVATTEELVSLQSEDIAPTTVIKNEHSSGIKTISDKNDGLETKIILSEKERSFKKVVTEAHCQKTVEQVIENKEDKTKKQDGQKDGSDGPILIAQDMLVGGGKTKGASTSKPAISDYIKQTVAIVETSTNITEQDFPKATTVADSRLMENSISSPSRRGRKPKNGSPQVQSPIANEEIKCKLLPDIESKKGSHQVPSPKSNEELKSKLSPPNIEPKKVLLQVQSPKLNEDLKSKLITNIDETKECLDKLKKKTEVQKKSKHSKMSKVEAESTESAIKQIGPIIGSSHKDSKNSNNSREEKNRDLEQKDRTPRTPLKKRLIVNETKVENIEEQNTSRNEKSSNIIGEKQVQNPTQDHLKKDLCVGDKDALITNKKIKKSSEDSSDKPFSEEDSKQIEPRASTSTATTIGETPKRSKQKQKPDELLSDERSSGKKNKKTSEDHRDKNEKSSPKHRKEREKSSGKKSEKKTFLEPEESTTSELSKHYDEKSAKKKRQKKLKEAFEAALSDIQKSDNNVAMQVLPDTELLKDTCQLPPKKVESLLQVASQPPSQLNDKIKELKVGNSGKNGAATSLEDDSDPLKDIEKFIADGVNLLKRDYKVDEDSVDEVIKSKIAVSEQKKECHIKSSSEYVMSVTGVGTPTDFKTDARFFDITSEVTKSEVHLVTFETPADTPVTTPTATPPPKSPIWEASSDETSGVRRSHRIKLITKTPKALVGRGLVRDKERCSGKDDVETKSHYSLDDHLTDLAEVEAKNAKFLKDMEERLSNFHVIKENEYKCERIVSREARKMICDCFLTAEEEERGELGCGEDCLNRLLMIECGPECNVKDRCTNKRFQKFLCSPCRVFRTEKKGFGIMADIEILPGEFIMEYVGEVIDGDQFECRRNLYSLDKNRHYYFMALRSDAIIDATIKGNISRFINHSCDPNAETQKWTVNGELRIGFFSRKSIMPGEEITFDYQYQRYGREAQRCYCEATSCRGWIGEEPNSDEGEQLDEDSDEDNLAARILKDVEAEDESDVSLIDGDDLKNKLERKAKLNIESRLISAINKEDEKKNKDEDYSKDVEEDTTTKFKKLLSKMAEKEAKKKELKKKEKKEQKRFGKSSGELAPSKQRFLEDPDIEDEVNFLSRCGLKNQSDTLRLSRLMVRAKIVQTRLNLLDVLRKGELPCRRLFLDYHGLRLLHGWMSEDEGDMNIRMALLETLECLPIVNKTVLTDSKVYQSVRNWCGIVQASPSPSDDSSKESSSSASQIRVIVPEEVPSDLQKLASKLTANWDSLPDIFRIPKRERIEQMKEHEREADRQYAAAVDDDFHKSLITDRYQRDRFGRSLANRFVKPYGMKDVRNISVVGSGSPSEQRKRTSLDSLVIPKYLSKEQRREMFAAKVARDEAEKRFAEERRAFDAKCRFFGLDPKRTRPEDIPFFVNSATGQWYSIIRQHISTPPTYGHVQPPEKVQSTDPADYELPDAVSTLHQNWKFAISPQGYIYYYHVQKRVPQWEPPGEDQVGDTDSDTQSDEAETDSSEGEDENLLDLNEDQMKAYIEKKVVTRRQKRYNYLVDERPISPRRDEDRIYNQNEMRKYKENKEKIRKRKEEIRRKRAEAFKNNDTDNIDDTSASGELPTNKPSNDDDKEGIGALPIQDYLLSSDEEDMICNKSPLIDKIVQGDKIVEELDALSSKRALKRAIAPHEELAKKLDLIVESGTSSAEKIESKKRKLEKKEKSKKSSKDSEWKYRKLKEKFRCEIAGIIVQHLKPYRKESCPKGRVRSNEDFNHLARKLTHFVMIKELKYCVSVGQTLVVTESVKNKSREFIKKYMSKYDEVYVKPKHDPTYKDIPFIL